MFNKILTSALFAGAVAGLFAALLQLYFVQPVLLHAELFESGQLVHTGVSAAAVDLPGFDVQRDLLTVAFLMLIYAGYGLVLVALMNISEAQGVRITARSGLIWGIAGFIAVHLAPAFSLPPEVPGSSAADVGDRQIWWYATIIATAIGLWILAFGKNWMGYVAAVVFILAPHIIGAPQPNILTGPAPTEIGGMFAARTLGVGLAAWALLGALSGYFWSNPEDT